MGHARLRHIPRTQKWIQVVDLIGEGGDAFEVSAASMNATRRALAQAAADPGLVRSTYLLMQLPYLARRDDFPAALRQLGIEVAPAPTLMDLAAGLTRAIDEFLFKNGGRTDLGEVAQIAAAETLIVLQEQQPPNLFEQVPNDARVILGNTLSSPALGRYFRIFFSRLIRKFLISYLNCTLPSFVGAGKRFPGIDDHAAFLAALDTHCYEAAFVVERFAGEWFWKATRRGGISEKDTQVFVYGAMQKLQYELAIRGGVDV